MFNEVRSALKMLTKHDLDKLIASVSYTSPHPDPRLRFPQFIACDPRAPAKSSTPIVTRITQMLQLRNIVRNLPDLRGSLSGVSSKLLQIISIVSPALDDHTVYSRPPGQMISDKRIEAIDSLIASSLNEENVQSTPRVREVFPPPLRTFETVSTDGYWCGYGQSVCG